MPTTLQLGELSLFPPLTTNTGVVVELDTVSCTIPVPTLVVPWDQWTSYERGRGRERWKVYLECGVPCFPDDFQDTAAGERE